MIIGLTGFIGSGKGEVARILVSEFNFKQLSFGDEVRAEAVRRGIEPTRENLQKLGQELPAQFGSDYWANKLVTHINFDPGANYVIDGIRNPGDVIALRKCEHFVLVAIDAPYDIRAHRVFLRARPGDPKTIERFKEADDADRGISTSGKPGQNTSKCVILADHVITNATSLQVLFDNVLGLLYKLDRKRFMQNVDFEHHD